MYSVYVIELDEGATITGRPPLYVGETSHTPEERYAQHVAGYLSSRVVTKHHRRLRPDLAVGFGPYATRDEGLKAELQLGDLLRSAGYDVHGGQGKPLRIGR